MAKASHLDITTLTIGGITLHGDEQSISLKMDGKTENGKAMGRLGASPQIVKRSASLSIDLLNAKTLPTRVSNLDVSVFTIGGTSYLADVQEIQLSGGYTHVMVDGVADEWEVPQVVAKDLKGSCALMVPTGSVPLMNTLDGAVTGWYVAFSFTLNGVAVTFTTAITSIGHTAEADNVQTINISFEGRDAQSGDYPTAPTGTTSLLEKALNASTTELAVEYETKAVDGINCTGNVVFAGFSIAIANGALVKQNYQFLFSGAPTNVLST